MHGTGAFLLLLQNMHTSSGVSVVHVVLLHGFMVLVVMST